MLMVFLLRQYVSVYLKGNAFWLIRLGYGGLYKWVVYLLSELLRAAFYIPLWSFHEDEIDLGCQRNVDCGKPEHHRQLISEDRFNYLSYII